MSGSQIGFIVWTVVGCLIIVLGIRALFAKKAVGFWANMKTFPVNDTKGYNRATGILFICYGIAFVLLGVPLLYGQNHPYILLSVLGVMLATIGVMAVYNIVIAKRYREE